MGERLNKVIAASGISSRRRADDLIADGRVSINGIPVKALGTLVEPSDTVSVDGRELQQPARVTYMVHKPRGTVSSRLRQGFDPIVTSLVPANPAVYPVGRLDKDSEGLLLLSNDGALTDKLTHPRFEHQKEYVITGLLDTGVTAEQAMERLQKGVKLGDGIAKADALALKKAHDSTLVLVITVHEGRHHLIRRMCATAGITVKRLVRTRISGLLLGELKPGEWKALTSDELKLLA